MARPARSRSGFTLVELLVALVLSGFVVTIVFELFLGQGRFAQLQTAREEVQQNARAGIDIIVSELRGVGPEAIMAASADALEFWAPRAWGIVCDARPEEITVLFPSAALSSLSTEVNGPDRLAIPPAGDSVVWTFAAATDTTSSMLNEARQRCLTLNPNPFPTVANWKDSRARIYTSDKYPNGVEITLLPRTSVYLFEPVRYLVGTSLPGNETWIKRNVGTGGTFPLAGPVPEVGGLVFRYFDSDRNELASPVDPGDLHRIAFVEISVETHSRATFNNVPQSDRASTVVYLRNR